MRNVVIVGHLPAGYLVSKFLVKRVPTLHQNETYIVSACMLGAVAPDIDLLYFYLIDNRQQHHHLYFPHLPVVWAVLLGLSVGWLLISRRKTLPVLAFAFSLNGMIHMVLDTIAGDIWWLGPWVDLPFVLVTVPARFQFWWFNFLLHWTFILELVVLLLAGLVWHTSRREN